MPKRIQNSRRKIVATVHNFCEREKVWGQTNNRPLIAFEKNRERVAAITGFEYFEQHVLDIFGEFKSITDSESRIREELRKESTKAESANAARAEAERAAAEARSAASAAAAGATQAMTKLAKAQDEIINLKTQLELTERQRTLLEERCLDISSQIALLEREIQQLKPLQIAHTALQRQYIELQDRVRVANEEVRSEVSRLENELHRVERCAAAGSEIRERAKLAAAAHARERRLLSAELSHASRELLSANSEITRLGALVAELRHQITESESKIKTEADCSTENLAEIKAALEAERAGASRLEQALEAALADNVTLAKRLHVTDNTPTSSQPAKQDEASIATNICPIDSFLAD